MVTAMLRAVLVLWALPLRRIVALGLGLSSLVFGATWLAIGAAFYNTALFAWRPLDWLVDLMGGLATLVLSWLLFPAVVTLILGLFLDRVAAAVEALDYPGRGPPRRQPWSEVVLVTLRLTAVTTLLNICALPLYLLVPGINLVLFLALNGYVFGRGYFEVVALRRLDAAAAKSLRLRCAGQIFFAGMAVAGLFALPLVNLVAPVIATAFMVHVFEALPGIAPLPVARSAV